MIKIKSKNDGDFCILNLTDPQLTAEEWENDNKTGNIFKHTTESLIERVKPDLITLSGDLSYAGDFVSYKNFADYFDKFQIPWTCCFGNHDNQDGADSVEKVVSEYKKHKYFLFEDCDKSLGIGNFVILIEKNGKNAEGVIIMDTHDKVPYKSDAAGKNLAWGYLTKEQLCWYEKSVTQLKNMGCNDTMLITHIPIHAYNLAAKAAFKNPQNDKSITLEQSYGKEVWNKGYENSYGVWHEPLSTYPDDEGAFDLISELGSTKTVICGHNHINNWVSEYFGVRFVFATKTGCGSYWEPDINGGTVISVNDNGVNSVHHEYVDVSDLL